MKKLFLFTFLLLHQSFFGQDISLLDTDNELTFDMAEETEINTQTFLNTARSSSDNEEFSSLLLKNRLEQLSDNSPFNVPYNATVERFIRLYLKTKKDDVSNLMDRANYYFPIFEEYLDKYDIPLEIKYLAVVESALKPTAKSSAGAKGLWQFMYHTGKEYGLNVSSYIDERTDPLKATEAACKYLTKLHNTFGDWDLALAAYNSGPGNVSKAIRRSGGLRNYWNIRQYLPAETRSYVPAFYTMFYLFEFGNEHQIYPKNIKISYFDTDTIHIRQKLTFLQIEKKLSIDTELLTSLNPQYKLGIIPHNDNSYHVLTLPKNLIGKFISTDAALEQEVQHQERPNYILATNDNSYVVKELDNLNKIARKFGITLHQLKKWNGLQTEYLIEGQRLVITDKKIEKRDKQQSITNSFHKEVNITSNTQFFKNYTVKEGESLFVISKKFQNVSIQQLRNWNNMWGVSYVKPGTQLRILTKIE